MRKLFLFLCWTSAVLVQSQNIQLHYDLRGAVDRDCINDFGETINERTYLTATFEWNQRDRLGDTYMFTDFDFSGKGCNIGLIYAEICRKFNLGKLPVQALIEFNGGVGTGFSIENAYLAGASYSHMFGKNFFNTYLAYKLNNFHRVSHDVQWTVVWNVPLFNDKLTFDGFLDVWTQNKNKLTAAGGKKVILLTEPQLWYNIVPKFAVGTEIEMTYNFVKEAFKVYPTVAIKYTFK